jgi:hypothetical protein
MVKGPLALNSLSFRQLFQNSMALHQPSRRSPSWMSTCRVVLLAGFLVTVMMQLELVQQMDFKTLQITAFYDPKDQHRKYFNIYMIYNIIYIYKYIILYDIIYNIIYIYYYL